MICARSCPSFLFMGFNGLLKRIPIANEGPILVNNFLSALNWRVLVKPASIWTLQIL